MGDIEVDGNQILAMALKKFVRMHRLYFVYR